MKKGKENPIKSIEDFADVVLKLLNPGVPYGKMHPQKLKLVEKLKKREEVLTQYHEAEVERAYERGVADGTGKPLLAIENVREAERERIRHTLSKIYSLSHSGRGYWFYEDGEELTAEEAIHAIFQKVMDIEKIVTPTKTDKQTEV